MIGLQMATDNDSEAENSAEVNSETLRRAHEQDMDVCIELDGLDTLMGTPMRIRQSISDDEDCTLVDVAIVDGTLPSDDGFEAHNLRIKLDAEGRIASWPIREGEGMDWPTETAGVESVEVVNDG